VRGAVQSDQLLMELVGRLLRRGLGVAANFRDVHRGEDESPADMLEPLRSGAATRRLLVGHRTPRRRECRRSPAQGGGLSMGRATRSWLDQQSGPGRAGAGRASCARQSTGRGGLRAGAGPTRGRSRGSRRDTPQPIGSRGSTRPVWRLRARRQYPGSAARRASSGTVIEPQPGTEG